jgi:hypothetical protein
MARFIIDANLPYIWDDVNNLIDNNNMISIYIDKIEVIK